MSDLGRAVSCIDDQLSLATMFALRRQAIRSAGRLQATRSACRYSTEHHGKPDDHHSSGHDSHHSGPVNESLGVCPKENVNF